MAKKQQEPKGPPAPTPRSCAMCIQGWRQVFVFTETMGRNPVRVTKEQYLMLLEKIRATPRCRSMVYEGVILCNHEQQERIPT